LPQRWAAERYDGSGARVANDDRSNLARRQADVLATFVSSGDAPAGIQAKQLAETTKTLKLKRRREAALAAPVLTKELGSEFENAFDAYAAATSYPTRGGPMVDGVAFGDFLRRLNRLPRGCAFENARLAVVTSKRVLARVIDGRMLLMWRWRGRVRWLRLF